MSDEWSVGEDVSMEGIYVATCTKIEDVHSELYDKDQLQFVFTIDTEGEFKGWEMSKWVSAPQGTLRPRMAIYPIAEALLGNLAEIHANGGKVRRADMIGKQAQIMVADYVKADGSQGNKIVSVSKVKKAPTQIEIEDVPFDVAEYDRYMGDHEETGGREERE